MRYFLEVSYDGRAFHGSQLQGEIPTVQLEINKALSTLLRKPVFSFGASRTDEGVHALCNIYHFDTGDPLADAFLYKLNAVLPSSVAVRSIRECKNPDANARFDALSRKYRYRIYTRKDPFLFHRAYYLPYRLNRDVLSETAAILKEYTDFKSFSKRNTQTRTSVCAIYQSSWKDLGDEFHFTVEANRFLRGMVRALVGTQLQVAKGRLSVAGFRKVIESGDCRNADFSVPGYGLYLEAITYPENYFL